MVYTGIFNLKPRHQIFADFICKKYSDIKFKRVLDVGAGRLCHLSKPLIKRGYEYSAIDSNIRLSSREIDRMGIKNAYKDHFYCNEFAGGGGGTDISEYDLILGLEPCMATEHIIRQALNYDKAFEILLCYENHDALNGQKFKTPEQWFNYLRKISKEVKIYKEENGYHVSNKPDLQRDRERIRPDEGMVR